MSIRVDDGRVKNRLRKELSSGKTGDGGVALVRQVGEIGIGGFMGMEHYLRKEVSDLRN